MGSKMLPMHPLWPYASNYDLHELGRWVAASSLYCSQHPPKVKAKGGRSANQEEN